MFSSLVGPDIFHNISLVTSKWDLLLDPSIGESREEELRENLWKDLIKRGSITGRFSGDRKSALAILKRVAFDQRMASTSGAPLAIQKEIVDEDRKLITTSAGSLLARSMKQERYQLQRENKEISIVQDEIDALRREGRRFWQGQLKRPRTHTTGQNTPIIDLNILADLDTEELLRVSTLLPGPVEGVSLVIELAFLALKVIIFSLGPILSLINFIRPTIRRLLRPKLPKHYSRIEWTCVSGEFLVPDGAN